MTLSRRLARQLLRRVLGDDSAGAIIGDLTEMLAARPPHRRVANVFWFWGQVISCLSPRTVLAIRADAPRPPRRRRPMDTLLADLRYALRVFRRAPAFAALVIVTMAGGIAATTVVYSAVDGMILRPFPFRDPGQLVGVGTAYPAIDADLSFFEHISPAEYLDAARATSLERVVAWDMGNRQVTVGDNTENLFSGFWWGDAFPTLGVEPFLGRGFLPSEIEAGDRVAVLSHRVWRNRFGADSALVGGQVLVNGDPFRVVGIMPPRTLIYGTDLWIPMPVGPEVYPRNRRQFQIIGRLAKGASLETANAELAVIARQVENEHGAAFPEYAGWGYQAMTWTDINVRAARPAGLILLGAVAFVMLLVTTNVATLLLSRAGHRSREVAVRAALGAGRRRIVRQFLTESVLLALAGAGFGIAMGWFGVSALRRVLETTPLPLPGQIAINGQVLLVTTLVAVLAGLIFGTVPALQLLRSDPQRTLQADGGGSTAHGTRLRLQRTLVAVEAALAITLLAGGGYLIRSVMALQAVEPGFRPERVLTMRLSLARERYSRQRVEPFFASLRERVAAIPGVRGVATVSQFPPNGFSRAEFRIDGVEPTGDDRRPAAFLTLASPGYFETIGMRLTGGRDIAPTDRADTPPIAVINEEFQRRFFGAGNPIGRTLQLGADGPTFEIVGITASAKNRGLDRPPEPEVFASTLQADGINNQLFLIVRTEGEPRALLDGIRGAVRAIDPDQPVYAIRTIDEAVAQSQFARRFSASLLGTFAAFALVLAAVGIYGVVGYAASQRTREVGVRMALGASRRSVAGLFVNQALAPVVAGVAVGLLAALGIGRAMQSLLFEVRAGDPVTLVAAGLLLGAFALAAAWVPARRASRLDPVRALRSE